MARRYSEDPDRDEELTRRRLFTALAVFVVLALVGGIYFYRRDTQHERRRIEVARRAQDCQQRAPSADIFAVQTGGGSTDYSNPNSKDLLDALPKVKAGMPEIDVTHLLGDPSYVHPIVSNDGLAYQGCQWVYVLSGDNELGYFQERDSLSVAFDAEGRVRTSSRVTAAPRE